MIDTKLGRPSHDRGDEDNESEVEDIDLSYQYEAKCLDIKDSEMVKYLVMPEINQKKCQNFHLGWEQTLRIHLD